MWCNFERVGPCIQSINDNCNIQWFRCMLGRARGAFGVFRMLINRAAVANWVLSVEGVGELLDKYCRGLF